MCEKYLHRRRATIMRFAGVVAIVILPIEAQAHWCNCLWSSRYNVVLRPAIDSIYVPETGDATVHFWVQNNMGYPLVNYGIDADASGFDVRVSVDTDTRADPDDRDYLLPGERLRHRLFVARQGGPDTLDIEDVEFFISFGGGIQDQPYGNTNPESDVIVKKLDNNLYPADPALYSDNPPSNQSSHLRSSYRTDFAGTPGDRAAGIVALLGEYCAGRRSWSSGGSVKSTYCPEPNGPPDTTCSNETRNDVAPKYDWQHLWAAGELAYRKDALSAVQLAAFRDRLKCGLDDPRFEFVAFALFVMGYLGDGTFTSDVADSAGQTAHDFLSGMASGTTAQACAAKAALHLLGDNNEADVRGCLSNANVYAVMVSAAALGIVDNDDAVVEDELLMRIGWLCPSDSDCGQDPRPLFAAHVANLVAWARRGWAAGANDAGVVSFYREESNAPPAPNASCSVVSTSPPLFRVAWPAVTGETFDVGYRVSWGTSPGSRVHAGYTLDTSFEPPDVAINTTYYVSVVAVDDSLNTSLPSSEISCLVPVQADPPSAVLNCTPTSGVYPLTVDCDCTGSSDPQDNIDHCWFALDGGSPEDGLASGVSYDFTTGGSHTVVLRVTDDTGLEDTAEVVLTINDPDNEPPTAVATADPTSGFRPLQVSFDSSGSFDTDGSIVSFEWDFRDNNTSVEANPVHTFSSVGEFEVTLTVTDDGSPDCQTPCPLTGTDVIRITVSERPANRPPPNDCGVVTPTSGVVPLIGTFDATACVDPDGDDLEVRWRVASVWTDPVDIDGRQAQHTFDSADDFTVTLFLTDDGDPPNEVTQVFDVEVLKEGKGGTLQPLIGGCACEAGSAASAWLALIGLRAWLRRRRRATASS